MKLKSNNLRFFKIKWFFYLSLIYIFNVSLVQAQTFQVCASKGNPCYTYNSSLETIREKCIGADGCFTHNYKNPEDKITYTACFLKDDLIGTGCAQNKDLDKCIKANGGACEMLTITARANPVTDGNADPVVTKGNADPVGYSQKLTNPLGEGTTIHSLIGKAINSLMGIVGALALLMFVYGGLTWMTSSGSQDKVKKGKDIMVWAAVGLIVIFSAYGLVKFIINILTK